MALCGMTGFGRADASCGAWSWSVEARSVNGRTLEARYRGPPGFDGLDRAAREAAQARFQRGQLTIGVQAKRADAAAAPRVNVDQLERYLQVVERYVRDGRAAAPSPLLPKTTASSPPPATSPLTNSARSLPRLTTTIWTRPSCRLRRPRQAAKCC